MARFPLLTDNHVRQPIVDALRRRGWDVVRAVDLFGEQNDDEELLTWAVDHGRVFVTCDTRMLGAVVVPWLEQGRTFRLNHWAMQHHRRMSDGDIVDAIEALTEKPGAFASSIEYLKPRR